MAAKNEADFDVLLGRIEARQQRAVRRAVWLTIVPILVGLSMAAFSYLTARMAATWKHQAVIAQRAAQAHQTTSDSLLQALTATRDTVRRARESLEAARGGINLFHAGRYDAAVRAYDNALRDDPSNSYILDLKGYALFKAGNLRDAAETIQRSIAADSSYGYGYFDLARVYCAQGRNDEALTAARQALKTRPDLRSAMLATDREFVRLCQPILTRIEGP